jgi:hypothetical protein
MDYDPKHFKKIGEDQHHLIFGHPAGHEIRIAKPAKEANPPDQNLEQGVSALPKNLSRGGKVQRFPSGGAVQDPNTIDYNAIQNDPGNLAYSMDPNQMQAGNAAAQASAPPDSNSQDQAPQMQPSAPQGPQNVQLPQSPQATQGNVSPNPMADPGVYEKAQQQEIGGLYGQAKAVGAQGKQEAIAATQQAQDLQDLKTKVQAHQDILWDESQKAAADVAANHIQAQPLPHNLGTAIGLIMGGVGGALTGQANPVLAYLQQQQKMNLDAQIAESGQKNNLMSFYTQQFGNVKDAANMVMAIDNNRLAAQFQAAASTAKDPMQRAAAENAAGTIIKGNYPLIQQTSIRQTLLGQMRQGQQGTQTAQGPGMSPQGASVASRFLAPNEATNDKVQKEIGDQENLNSINAQARDSFNKVAGMQTFANRFGDPIHSDKQIDAEWGPMSDKLTREVAGRVTPISTDLISSLKPKMSDNAQDIAIKREKLNQLLEQNRATPNLNQIGVSVSKGNQGGGAVANTNVAPGYKVAQR